jgi:hypothetical protein
MEVVIFVVECLLLMAGFYGLIGVIDVLIEEERK